MHDLSLETRIENLLEESISILCKDCMLGDFNVEITILEDCRAQTIYNSYGFSKTLQVTEEFLTANDCIKTLFHEIFHLIAAPFNSLDTKSNTVEEAHAELVSRAMFNLFSNREKLDDIFNSLFAAISELEEK